MHSKSSSTVHAAERVDLRGSLNIMSGDKTSRGDKGSRVQKMAMQSTINNAGVAVLRGV
jgi:hypothetical protein